ncbi:MAG: segregation and condensation protein A [Pseudobdellovibrionaceae bacterium]
MSINIQLPHFEGPLALLLYLIRKEEMDIMNINIHEITQQYLEFIKLMKELDLEVAGEFVAMASTLIHIKSKMLLPQYNDQGEVVEQEDPRKELVQKLLEYQKYQEASKLLNERPLVGRDVWLRGQKENLRPPEEELQVEDNALYALISIYRQMIKTARKKIHQVAAKTQSIASRILEIKDRLIVGQKIAMSELLESVEERTRQTLITFLSLLELGKMQLVSLYQTEVYADIWIEARKPIDTEMISKVEEYDALDAAQVLEGLIAKTEAAATEENEALEDEMNEDGAEAVGSLASASGADDSAPDLDTMDIATDDDILAAEAELEKDNQNV